jgi:hypothetical protein
MAAQPAPAGSGMKRAAGARALVNRSLLVAALLAIVVGVALGQTFITWLNATLL